MYKFVYNVYFTLGYSWKDIVTELIENYIDELN